MDKPAIFICSREVEEKLLVDIPNLPELVNIFICPSMPELGNGDVLLGKLSILDGCEVDKHGEMEFNEVTLVKGESYLLGQLNGECFVKPARKLSKSKAPRFSRGKGNKRQPDWKR